MWQVKATENNGEIHTITTDSEYYAKQRYYSYRIANKCGYIKDVTIEKIEGDSDDN